MPYVILPEPVLTLTHTPDGQWNVLLNGEPFFGPYAWRESAETVIETLTRVARPR